MSSRDERLKTLDSIDSANICQYVFIRFFLVDWRWNFGWLFQILEKCAHEGTNVSDLKNRL
jgi:hypothetical protein